MISTNATAANRWLAEVDGVSKQFGLHLNRNKCCYISVNGSNVIKFADGQKLNRVEETTHLGHQITQEMDVKHEIQHKMHQTLKMWFELDTFWKTTVCSNRWKLQVYDAILTNKLLYGLETVHLTQTQQKKVNAFQLRGLRKILGLSTTFVNRSNANEHVSQKANEEIGHTPGTPSKIKLFSDLQKKWRVKLAGHVLRSNNSDPLKRVSYERNPAVNYNVGKRRVGGPRPQWLLYTSRYVWEKIERGTFENTVEQNHKLLGLARSRQF